MRLQRHRGGLATAVAVVGATLVVSGLGAAPPTASAATRHAAAPAPADLGHPAGAWSRERVGAGVWRISWRAPQRLPLGSDQPQIVSAGRSLGPSVVTGGGRVVSVQVRSQSAPDLRGLHVVLSGDRLDVAGDDVAAAVRGKAAAASFPLPTTTLPDDPATPGPYSVVSSDYSLDPVKVPQMKEPIEMVGHVVEPAPDAVAGPRPLVLFLHGRHIYCYNPANGHLGFGWPCRGRMKEVPGQLGYDYIQQVLASQGFATVSIRVNGINAQDGWIPDAGADARARIVQAHLDHWVDLATDHQVDLSRVVLVGHSRGGEGVNRASVQIPLSAPYRIVGQVLIAPTDFGTQTVGYVPTVTLLPYCDGDVFDLQGQKFTDSARDLAADDSSLKSSVMVLGANHNFFNTEWTPGISAAPSVDDWGEDGARLCGTADPGRLTAAEQRSVGVAYVVGAARLFALDDQRFLPLFDGTSARVGSTGDAVVLSHAIGGGRALRRPGIDSGRSLATGAESQLCLGAVSYGSAHRFCGRTRNLGGNTPHWGEQGEFAPQRQELEVAWSAAGQSAGLVFDDPLDLSGGRRLELRTIVDPLLGTVRLHLVLRDADGASADAVPVGGTTVRALPRRGPFSKRWAQSVIVDASSVSGVDLTRITGVDLVGESADGRVWVLDAASAPAALAAVPDKRLAVVSLGQARVPEGDTDAAVGYVPFTVAGQLTKRAAFVVGVTDLYAIGTHVVDLAPGQTTGSVPIDYSGNTVDDQAKRRIYLSAFAREGVVIDDYLGQLTVLDDDPAPKVRIHSPSAPVAEGSPLPVEVKLSDAVGYYTVVEARVVAGPGRSITVADVPAAWLRRQGAEPDLPGSMPLWKTKLSLWEAIRPGRTTATLSIPTRSDRVAEGIESVTLRVLVRLGGQRMTDVWTVRVRG